MTGKFTRSFFKLRSKNINFSNDTLFCQKISKKKITYLELVISCKIFLNNFASNKAYKARPFQKKNI